MTWAVGILGALALVAVPGTLALRALGLPWVTALAASPAAGSAVCSVMALVLGALDVPCTPFTAVALPSAALALACLARAAGRRRSRARGGVAPRHLAGSGAGAAGGAARDPSWGEVALYVCLGVAVGALVFVRALPAPDAIMQRWDVYHHANAVRSFADSAMMSPLGSSFYPGAADRAANPLPGAGGFYPSGWHVVCALLVELAGVGVAAAMNATSFAFAFVAYPLATLLVLSRVFPDRPRARLGGALACLLVVAFPWAFFVYGPILPNLAAFAVVPALAALLMDAAAAARGGAGAGGVARRLAAWALACAGAFFLHPNSLFALGFLLVPWLVSELLGATRGRLSRRARAAAAAGLVLACAAVWVAAWSLPAMHGVASQYWWPYASPGQAVVNVLTLAYTYGWSPNGWSPSGPGVVAAALVAWGLVVLWRDGGRRWLAVSYAAAACLVLVDALVPGDAVARSLLTGFWYNDPVRIGGIAALAATPALARGLDALLSWAQALASAEGRHQRAGVATAAGVAAAVMALALAPDVALPGGARVEMPFATYAALTRERYGTERLYTAQESAFVDEARAVAGDDLVINNPFDGSLLSYALNDLHTCYRYFQGYGQGETPESVTVRTRLADIAHDDEVVRAVRSMGARYVLVLDISGVKGDSIEVAFDPAGWEGITSIDDDTPGFSVVLAEGDMRLYRIDGA